MAVEQTLIILKPNSIRKNVMGAILDRFEKGGLKICAARMQRLDRATCDVFYQEHIGKPFFAGLVEFMTSGPVLVLVFGGEGAIAKAREIMGATNPADAAPGTIRADFADSMTENAVHGSDSPASAEREISIFFSADQIVNA
jgi:nucleoside-diphosphate kinase